MFTADNLPEAARAKLDDFNAWLKQPAAGWIANFNAITAIILNRLDAAHGGRLSALLNGTAPVMTDEPVANTQAEARESEEIARLKGEVERLAKERDLAVMECQQTGEQLRQERSLHAGTKSRAEHAERERDEARQELATLRAHADKLEALLTVDGVDGPVKTWLPFEACLRNGKIHWFQAACQPAVYVEAWGTFRLPSLSLAVRQSTAPAAEPRKRWRYPLSATSTVYVTTDAPCSINDLPEAARDLAVEVIGEAGE